MASFYKIIVLLLTSFIFLLCSFQADKPSKVVKKMVVEDTLRLQDTLPPSPPPKKRTISVIGVGDIMMGTNYPSTSYLPPNGGRDLLTDVIPILQKGDITFGNLEGVILDKGGTAKRCANPNVCYAFRSPESYMEHFVNAGFDVMSIANNHSGDFGPEGRRRTKELLRNATIEYAGLAGTDEYAIFEKDGIKYGFCAFAPNRGTCDIRNLPYATGIVKKLEEQCDIVIVSFHGGAEGAKNQHVTRKTETYYGENRGNVYKFSHAVIDAGADIVFGHGPHVTRAMELYKDRFIIYSLGNFCTYGRFNLRDVAGIAPIAEVVVDRNGVFLHAQLTSIYQTKTKGPHIDPQNRAIKKIKELTKADFPETPLSIGDDGFVYKK